MSERDQLIDAIARTAEAWSEPEHEPRAEAVKKTVEASDTFTEEATAFAVNQQMSLLTRDALQQWAPAAPVEFPKAVGVLNAGNIPFVELQDFVAVLISGHRYLGTVSSKSPYLMQGFARDMARFTTVVPPEFVEADELFRRSEAIIATGSDETASWVADRCDEHDIPAEARLIRGHRFSAAVVDGRESEDELESLAEDVLLHEGFGCRNIAVIWAPKNQSPDELLDAFAHFRAVFPAHEATPGRLKMQKAFLQAVDLPHAYGEGLEFLMSKGDPEPQQPGHVRWSEYDTLDQVEDWLVTNRDAIQLLVAREGLHAHFSELVPMIRPGEAQRPPLDWCPDGADVVAFLLRLGATRALPGDTM